MESRTTKYGTTIVKIIDWLQERQDEAVNDEEFEAYEDAIEAILDSCITRKER